MNTTFKLALVAGSMLAASVSPSAAACDARGDYCSYPRWASNAFAGPRARVPTGVADPDRNSGRDRWRYSHGSDRRRHRSD